MKTNVVYLCCLLFVLLSNVSYAKDYVVLESTANKYKKGDILKGTEKLMLSGGQAVSVISSEGNLIKYRSGFSGTIESIPDKGNVASPNSSNGKLSTLFQSLVALLQEKQDRKLGTTRSFSSTANKDDGNSAGIDPWVIDVSTEGDKCIYSQHPLLWQPPSNSSTIYLRTETKTAELEKKIRWPRGAGNVAWPISIPLEDGAAYEVEIIDRYIVNSFNLHISQRPFEKTVFAIAWMMEQGCIEQANRALETLPVYKVME